jgi:hypothetical protein
MHSDVKGILVNFRLCFARQDACRLVPRVASGVNPILMGLPSVLSLSKALATAEAGAGLFSAQKIDHDLCPSLHGRVPLGALCQCYHLTAFMLRFNFNIG